MKYISTFCFLLILFSSNKANAQSDDSQLNKFLTSIAIYFQYPEQLRKNCIPTIALMKINLDKKGKIDHMDVSDSADMLFKLNFQTASSKFDKKSLEAFAAKFSLTNTSILIPYFNHLSSKMCPSPLSPGDLNKYKVFSGVPLQGNRLYTDPLIAIEKDEYDIN